MKRTLLAVLMCFALITACTSAPPATPTATITVAVVATTTSTLAPTATPTTTPIPTATATSIPTATATSIPTPTSTREPTVAIVGLAEFQYPTVRLVDSVIAPYSNATNLTPEQVKSGLTAKAFKDYQASPFKAIVTADGTPLLVEEKSIWQEATVRRLADKINFKIGGSVGGYGFANDYNNLVKVQAREFNLGQIGIGWTYTEPERGKYVFNPVDSDTNLATRNGMQTYGHPVIWCGQVPQWIAKGGFSRAELVQIVQDRVTTLLQRYKGKIQAWNVVNEYRGCPQDIFDAIIGSDYVEIAFRAARQADPSAILVYNDYWNHSLDSTDSPYGKYNGRRTEITRQVVQNLKSKGLVDGVGLQMHLFGNIPPNKQDVIATMRSYGLPVYVTEFDVNMKDVKGTRDERFKVQAKIYKEMLQAAIESGVCKGFMILGVIDRLSAWEVDPNYPFYSPDADPLPFDDNFQPKPAYFALLAALLSETQQ
jgi:endo-1,4-beta-xylanase